MKYIKTYESVNLNEDSAEYYRGVYLEDVLSWCKGQPVPSYDPMPLDFEVVEYGIGDAIEDMDEDDIEEWVKDICYWYDGSPKSIKGGLNVTTDFENAKGYGDYVIGINSLGDSAEFSDAHVFLRDCNDTELVFIYDCSKDEFYKPEDFNLNESWFGKKSEAEKTIDKLLKAEIDETKINFSKDPLMKVYEFKINDTIYAITRTQEEFDKFGMGTFYIFYINNEKITDSSENKKLIKLYKKVEKLYLDFQGEVQKYNL